MKTNKKILNLLAAMTLAVPMAVSAGTLNNIYAESIITSVVNSTDNKPLSGVTLAFYSTANNVSKKIFTVKTNEQGKLNKESVVAFNSFDVSNIIDDKGDLNLKDGSYYYVDESVLDGFVKNVKPVKFSVVNGVAPNIERSYSKLSSDKAQLIVNAVDASGNPVEGATLDLFKQVNGAYVRLASLTTDSDGLLLDVINRTSEDSNTVIDTSNGTLILPSGSYKVVPKNSTSALKPVKNEYAVEVAASKIVSLAVNYSKSTSSSGSDQSQGNNLSEVKTGVKILVRNEKKTPLENQEIAIYSTDANGSNEKLLFVGKTNSQGIFEYDKVSKGAELLGKNGVVALEAGNYYYKLYNYSNAKKHTFKVEAGKVNNQVFTITVGSSSSKTSNGTTSSTGSNVSKLGSTLAKTGVESTLAYSASGIAMVSGGLYILKRKK